VSVALVPEAAVRLRGMPDPVDVVAVRPCDNDGDRTVLDPICGMRIEPGSATLWRVLDGRQTWFCGSECAERVPGP
jgi:YHS domain-containing protein